MGTDYDKSRAEECRYEVRHHLAVCSTMARDIPAISRNINRNNDFTAREIEAALIFLLSLDQVEQVEASLGSTKYYQITAAGTLADERGE